MGCEGNPLFQGNGEKTLGSLPSPMNAYPKAPSPPPPQVREWEVTGSTNKPNSKSTKAHLRGLGDYMYITLWDATKGPALLRLSP